MLLQPQKHKTETSKNVSVFFMIFFLIDAIIG